MFQDISNLSNTDPKISKNAALGIIQHVSENKGEMDYLLKRLVNGMESVKIATRTGCYSTLCSLLSLHYVEPLKLFDLIQKSLVTSKENSKKERRLIYIARLLSTGAIFRVSQVGNLTKDNGDLLTAALKDIVDLAQKKSAYLLLAIPFLSHILNDNTLKQETFDEIVWPAISPLIDGKISNKKIKKEEDDDDDEDEDEKQEEQEATDLDGNSISFICKVQLALDCKNGDYRDDFECLKDAQKIAKALLKTRIPFEDMLLSALWKYLSTSAPDQVTTFWEALLENIKSTQFDLLTLAVRSALEASISPFSIISSKLLHLLLSVFRQDDKDFRKKSKETIDHLLKWGKEDSENLRKKKKRSVLKILFGSEDPPNLLHEYKLLHSVIRPFLLRLSSRDLETVHGILVENLSEEKLGPRMAIVYLQTLGKIAQCNEASAETKFEIGKRLLNLALGKEEIQIKSKAEEKEEKEKESFSDFADVQSQLKKVSMETLNLILSFTYAPEFMTLLSSHIIENCKELTDNENTRRVLKDSKKSLKKVEDPRLEYILRAYAVRVLLDEGQVVSNAGTTVENLIEMAKKFRKQEGEGEDEEKEGENENIAELMQFLVNSVLREANPAFHFEGMFNKLLIEGKVKEDTIQVLAEMIDIAFGGEEKEEEEEDGDDGEEEEEENDSGSEYGDDASHPKKKTKFDLDPAQIAKLQAEFGVKGKGDDAEDASDSENSIALDEASEEDLKRMDASLAKVFAVKKSMIEEERGGPRALMRTLKLVELYIRRSSSKGMPVSSLLLLLMPVVHSIQSSLKMKNFKVPIKVTVIGLLESLLRVKKFTGCGEVTEGTFASIASDLYEMSTKRRNRFVRELLEHSVIVLTKCFLQKREGEGNQKQKRGGKKEEKKFIELYCKAVDSTKNKLKKRKIKTAKKGGKKGNASALMRYTSRFVRQALETFPDWEGGVKAIKGRISLGIGEEEGEEEVTPDATTKPPTKKGGAKIKNKTAKKAEKRKTGGDEEMEENKSVIVNGTGGGGGDGSPSKKKMRKKNKA